MSEVRIHTEKSVFCPKDQTSQDPDFCHGCKYYHGTSLDVVDCRYGEKLIDKVVKNAPIQNFKKLVTDDWVYLINERKYLILRLEKSEFRKYDLDIPETEIKAEKTTSFFDIDFEFEMKVEVSDYSYKNIRMITVIDEEGLEADNIIGVNTDINWLWNLDKGLDLYKERPENTPIYIEADGRLKGLIAPVIPSGESKEELLKLAEIERGE